MTAIGQHRAERRWRETWIEWAELLAYLPWYALGEAIEWARWASRRLRGPLDLAWRLPILAAWIVVLIVASWIAHGAEGLRWHRLRRQWPPSTPDSRLREERS